MVLRAVWVQVAAALACGLTVAACGGEAFTSGGQGVGADGGSGGSSASGGSSGSSGQGGSSGSSGSSGSGGSAAVSGSGGSSGGCVQGGACSIEGKTCTDGSCCPCMYTCEDGTWNMTACAACVPPLCPPDLPSSGAPCDTCANPVHQPCEYSMCPSYRVVAVCDGERWNVQEAPCQTPGCCASDADCGAGSICASTVCKTPVAGGCWRDSDCGPGGFCSGAFVCPCNADCADADYPGYCIQQTCCGSDAHCGTGHCVNNVCKPALFGGTCWSDADCYSFGGPCYGAQVCPCEAACLVPDAPGYCGL